MRIAASQVFAGPCYSSLDDVPSWFVEGCIKLCVARDQRHRGQLGIQTPGNLGHLTHRIVHNTVKQACPAITS